MRAIVIATGYQPESTTFSESMPSILLPLVDRPFIQHVTEYLIDQGVNEFDFILSQAPEQIETLLGDGRRWGSSFNFHLAKDARNPYRLLRSIAGSATEPALLVHADRLPAISLAKIEPATTPTVFCFEDAEGIQKWTGWASLAPAQLAELPANYTDDCDLFGAYLMLFARDHGRLVVVEPPLSVERPELLLEAQGKVLNKEFAGLMLQGRESDPGVWISRNVSLHPTARIVAPAFIGSNCRIGAGVQIGPNAAIGSDCILDKRCTLENTLVMSGSYVGEALELAEAIVDKNRLLNVRVGVAVSVADSFILGGLADRHLGRFAARVVSRGAAVTLLALTWPVLLLTALILKLTRTGPVLNKISVVQLPAATAEHDWRTFDLWSFRSLKDQTAQPRTIGCSDLLLTFLPGLVNIALGHLHFAGVAPRNPDQLRSLPHDWLSLYLRSKTGLITEAYVHQGANPGADELYASEAFYAVSSGLKHDLLLVLKYFGRIARDSFVRSAHSPVTAQNPVPQYPSLPWKT
ncbi:MAG TPA: NDP-sugar synthase [Pyrinomonadaceae bacterium]|nr:NDP-sugar synthase [Pyrinomonadaceae bacterium]